MFLFEHYIQFFGESFFFRNFLVFQEKLKEAKEKKGRVDKRRLEAKGGGIA